MTGKELQRIYKNSDLSGDEFASKLGIHRGYLYKLFDLEKIEEKYVNKLNKTTQKETVFTQNPLPLIPIDAMAGFANGEIQVLSTDLHQHYVIPDFTNKADYLIRVSGNSMYPKYYNGDVVACKLIPGLDFVQWGCVYILDTNQGALCKRLKESKIKGNVIAYSDNDKYPPFELPMKSINKVALVVGLIRLE